MKIAAIVFFASLTALANECLQIKAAFDIGSGATKMKVARVDTCLQKIDKMLLEADLPVAYKESLQGSTDNMFNEEIQKKGIEALNNLKQKAQAFNPDSFIAVATSAFRTAFNGSQTAKRIEEETGVPISIIDQDQEALLGFAAASKIAKKDLKEIVVWDIGGGSMQITSYNGPKDFDIYRGKIASASFKKHLIEEIQGANPKEIFSPNPIEEDDSYFATRDARILAKMTVPEEIKNKIKKGAEIIGIGGVHYFSIREQAGGEDFYTQEDVEAAIGQRLNKTDEEIGGNYASTEVSNLILVKGFMEGLGIERVNTGRINLADGILVGSELLN